MGLQGSSVLKESRAPVDSAETSTKDSPNHSLTLPRLPMHVAVVHE